MELQQHDTSTDMKIRISPEMVWVTTPKEPESRENFKIMRHYAENDRLCGNMRKIANVRKCTETINYAEMIGKGNVRKCTENNKLCGNVRKKFK